MALPALRQGLRFQWRIVTGARADGQASAIPRSRRHIYDPKASILLFIRGLIDDGVLCANVTSDSITDRDHVFCRGWQESFAAGGSCKLLERPQVPIGVVLVKDAYGVNDCVRLTRHSKNPVQFEFAGVVPPIADHNQNLLVPIALLQMIERSSHSIVESRHAICANPGQGALQLSYTARERHVDWKAKRYLLVEMNHKHLILGIAGAGKRKGGDHAYDLD